MGDYCLFARSCGQKKRVPSGRHIDIQEEQEPAEVNVGAVATGSGSNLFGVSGRLASWVRELSSLRSRASDDAAAEPLQPPHHPLPPHHPHHPPRPNGLLHDTTGC
ncbi:unnamed protein product [Parnassius apollo]|uniref:(apollo) hypothetical protein n=1 Tax=Parnassius apollo TaxID=110799 RepID=A0A8S3WV34_PARAO|nr:unnamed protein product [Parnassius apollo]